MENTLLDGFNSYNKEVWEGKARQDTLKDFYCGATVAYALGKKGVDIFPELTRFKEILTVLAVEEEARERAQQPKVANP